MQKISQFIISGLIVNLINFVIFVIFSSYTNDIFASAVFGYLVGLLFSFFINRNWVFRSKAHKSFNKGFKGQIVYFVLAHVASASLMGVSTSLMVEILAYSVISAFLVAGFFIACLNYLVLDKVVFRVNASNR